MSTRGIPHNKNEISALPDTNSTLAKVVLTKWEGVTITILKIKSFGEAICLNSKVRMEVLYF